MTPVLKGHRVTRVVLKAPWATKVNRETRVIRETRVTRVPKVHRVPKGTPEPQAVRQDLRAYRDR